MRVVKRLSYRQELKELNRILRMHYYTIDDMPIEEPIFKYVIETINHSFEIVYKYTPNNWGKYKLFNGRLISKNGD